MYVCILHEHVLMGEKVVYVCVWGGGLKVRVCVCVRVVESGWLSRLFYKCRASS